ncbi:hypothetical protein H5410_055773 [Solanum commersonii]|uniref:Uncharacterized protein n=1 Tax=Solanum commersonii TaxID=4109 RepID=A0A9J5WK45_SOLCO|nr:hypothetical protein H5410_055773 [Solanum commersonii]
MMGILSRKKRHKHRLDPIHLPRLPNTLDTKETSRHREEIESPGSLDTLPLPQIQDRVQDSKSNRPSLSSREARNCFKCSLFNISPKFDYLLLRPEWILGKGKASPCSRKMFACWTGSNRTEGRRKKRVSLPGRVNSKVPYSVVKRKRGRMGTAPLAARVFDPKGMENERRICVHYLWSGVTILNLFFPISPFYAFGYYRLARLGPTLDLFENYQGIADLKSGKIVTPLPPKQTFLDDPLRVLELFILVYVPLYKWCTGNSETIPVYCSLQRAHQNLMRIRNKPYLYHGQVILINMAASGSLSICFGYWSRIGCKRLL